MLNPFIAYQGGEEAIKDLVIDYLACVKAHFTSDNDGNDCYCKIQNIEKDEIVPMKPFEPRMLKKYKNNHGDLSELNDLIDKEILNK